jgi:hypothetical protein
VEPSGNGSGRPTESIDTSDWFESQLPPAAEQPEAKIELSSLSGPELPVMPPLSEVADQARQDPPPAG